MDHIQVAHELCCIRVGLSRPDLGARRCVLVELSRRRGEARIDAGQRAPVRLVAAVLGLVGRAGGECLEFLRHGYDAQRLRQFAAEPMHFLEVEVEGDRGLPAQRVPGDLVGDEGVAVAIAADPASEPEECRHGNLRLRPARTQQILDLVVQPRQLVQKGVAIVGEAVLDLVADRQPQLAQDARLPHRQNQGAQRLVVGLALVGGQLHAVALHQEPADFALGVEDALALHLGGMRGEHGRDERVAEELRNGLRPGTGRGGALQRHRQAALLGRRTGQLAQAPPPDVVQILGDVGELGEIGEGADHGQRRRRRKQIQQGLQFLARPVVDVAPEADRGLPDLLDQIEGVFPFLLAQRVAEQPAEEADVFAQRQILVEDRGLPRAVVHAVRHRRVAAACRGKFLLVPCHRAHVRARRRPCRRPRPHQACRRRPPVASFNCASASSRPRRYTWLASSPRPVRSSNCPSETQALWLGSTDRLASR